MKLRNLMFLALLGPIAQPMEAKPAVTFGPDALGQPAGFVGQMQTPDQPKAEKKKGHKAEEPKAQKKKPPKKTGK